MTADKLYQRVLPIFPLPLVQFPGAITPLHIFEERYRKMLHDVMLTDKTFGITYHSDEQDPDAPPSGSIGCTVEILLLQPMPDGRSNILCLGGQRYYLLNYVEGEPYLQAEVEFFHDEPTSEDLTPQTRRATRLFQRLLKANKKLKDASAIEEADTPDLPEDPEELSFAIAASLELPPEDKQTLLEMTSTAHRLSRLNALLDELATTYERRAIIHGIAKTNGHGGTLPV
jgi:ATP-dependent Lon protease